MKNKLTIILTILFTVLTIWGCKNSNSDSFPEEGNFDKDASYAMGMSIGASFKNSLDMDGITLDIDEFMNGFRDSLTGGRTRFDEYQAMEIVNAAFSAFEESKNAEALEQQNAFLAENNRKPGVITTSSGLQYEIINETDGPKPSFADIVRVHYEGRLLDGTIFDNTYDYGAPIEIPLNGVISGWAEGLQLMSIGSKYRFFIPSELGYGPGGAGPIPPYAVLIFEVELIDILN